MGAESLKGVFSAFSRTDIPFDPYKYGQFLRDTVVLKVVHRQDLHLDLILSFTSDGNTRACDLGHS
eukprot:669891-Hanusia_phi.AAC.3